MNAAALYGLKQEIQFNAIQSPTRLVAAPVSVWHDWLAVKVHPLIKVQELEPAADAETQLAAKDQQIADQKSEFARLKDLIAAETAAREKDKEQFNGKIEQLQKDHSGKIEQLQKDHSGEIEQLNGKIEQLRKEHSGEIEQLNGQIEQLQKEIEQLNKDQDDQGKRVQLLETEVREHNQVIAVLRAGKATFDESKTIFDESKAAFDETFNVVGRLASTSRARKRSSAGAMEKHTGDTELDGEEEPNDSEEEPQAKKTRTEDEEHDE